MAFLDVFKREDGSWNIGLIMAVVVVALAALAGGYAVYYMAYPRRVRDTRFDNRLEPGPAAQEIAREALGPHVDKLAATRYETGEYIDKDIGKQIDALNKYRGLLGMIAEEDPGPLPDNFYEAYDPTQYPAVAKPMYELSVL